MPLSPASARTLLNRRTVVCEGHDREDGLLEVEGRLTDVKGYVHGYGWRDPVPAGEPIHEMWVRIRFDTQLLIHAIESSTDSAPYPTCREIAPNLQRLVGLRIAGGFKDEMRKRVGHTEGCTHVVTLIEALANAAIQALASKLRDQGQESVLNAFGARDPSRPPLIDTCHTYAADSPVVAKLWPQFHRPRGEEPTSSGSG
jgi:hypothetical protein